MSAAERAEVKQSSGKSTVPQGFVYGIPIGGCNDGAQPWHGIVPLVNSGKLEKAIAAGAKAAAAAKEAGGEGSEGGVVDPKTACVEAAKQILSGEQVLN